MTAVDQADILKAQARAHRDRAEVEERVRFLRSERDRLSRNRQIARVLTVSVGIGLVIIMMMVVGWAW